MEVRDIVETLGVADARARVRAGELERLLRPRTPGGVLAQCRGAACVLLACREHGVRLEAREVALASCVTVDALLGAVATCQRILGIQYVACIAALLLCSFDVAAAVATDRQWGCARCAVPWGILPTRPLSLHCSTGLLMQTSNLTNHRCNINNFWKQLQGKVPGDDSCSTACAHEP